jgi:histidine transport system ATP-binding protein
MMAENKLNVIDLHKRYGEHEVLKGVSLQANAGDVISIIGSSGSGKVPSCAALTSSKSRVKARLW